VRFLKDFVAMFIIFTNVGILFYLRVKTGLEVEIVVEIITMTVAMMNYDKDFANSLMEAVDVYNLTQSSLDVLMIEREVEDKEEAIDLERENIQLDGKIEFKSVDFSYKEKETITKEDGTTEDIEKKVKVFNGLSATIDAGSKIGITGFSGSGRSTFISLIMRYFDIDGGHIIFNDKYDIRDITQESLRKSISYIKEDTTLFSRSIRENINYGKPEATNEEIRKVAEDSGCLEFIMELPERFDTVVGEGGFKLSTGQEKSIIIARLMLKNSPIVILDEFLQGVDNIMQAKINLALDKLVAGRTVIRNTNNLPSLQDMDKILVFKNGEIVEQGKHDELMKITMLDENGKKVDGYYRKMWDSQMEDITQHTAINELKTGVKSLFGGILHHNKKQ
jgi:ABC-type multidrug transport system fused ATPase/permease subunit